MDTENAPPPTEQVATAQEPNEVHAEDQQALPDSEQPAKQEEAPKKEKSPEEREIQRLRRRVDNLTRRLYQGGAKDTQQVALPNSNQQAPNTTQQSDNEALTLSRSELQELVDKEARKLAPTIKQQETEIEHRRAVVTRLATEWGKERFDALASDLDDAFDGLMGSDNRPKPAADAIFETEDPASLIEYLADPDNADEAEALGRMSALQAGRAITKLETKLAAKKAEAKPQPSKAPAPIEALRGEGTSATGYRPNMSDAEFAAYRRRQIAQRR